MRLIDCFIPSLAFLRHFQSQPSGDMASVRPQLDELLTEAVGAAKVAGKSDIDTQEALFELVVSAALGAAAQRLEAGLGVVAAAESEEGKSHASK